MIFKYLRVELRKPFAFLWNDNNNALITSFIKPDQCTGTVCPGYLQESASRLLLSLYSITTVTSGQPLFLEKKKREKNLHRQRGLTGNKISPLLKHNKIHNTTWYTCRKSLRYLSEYLRSVWRSKRLRAYSFKKHKNRILASHNIMDSYHMLALY